jgi:hypothetical protein
MNTAEITDFLDRLAAAIKTEKKSELLALRRENEQHPEWAFEAAGLRPRFDELANKAAAILYC